MAVSVFRMGRAGVLAAMVGIIWASPAWSDTIVMTNGDRLSGEVLLMDSGKLVLKTDYAGEIRISWEQVAQLQTDDPMLLKAKTLPVDLQARLVPGIGPRQVGTVAEGAAGVVSDQVAMADIQRIVRPHALLRDWSFDGGVDLAMNASHASSTNQNWSASAQATARRDLWRHGVKLDYMRKAQNSVVAANNYNAAYSVDRFLSDKMFVRGGVRFGRDHIDNPAHQLVFSAGPGYQFWDDELGQLSVSSFLTHTRYKYQDEVRDNFQTVGLGWNYTRYLAGKQWQVFTTGEVHRALRSESGYSFEVDLGLRYNVTQWMSLYAKSSYNRIDVTKRPATNERTYSLGLGVHW